jgi:hypothetical protein
MPIKPIPLAAFTKELVPPVTGIGGNLSPVANSFDPTGNFVSRPRAGSANKKRRLDEIDRVFDLSAAYPPLTPPDKPALNMAEIKSMLVAATATGEEVGPLLEDPSLDPKMRAVGALSLALLNVVTNIIENGLVPLTGGGGAGPDTQRGPSAGFKVGPPPPPKTPAGIKELKDCLEKADLESILFDANLGPHSIGNRANLNNAFSIGLRAAAINTAEGKNQDPAESVRMMNDALECVSDMDFIGLKSEKAKEKPGTDTAAANYYTMPIKLRFEDRNSRLHFERTIKASCGLRAVMSLPKALREEQGLFSKALRDRYPGEMISVRPDVGTLHFVAFRKNSTEKRWTKCCETIPIPPGVALPNYKVRSAIVLPPVVTVAAAVDMAPAVAAITDNTVDTPATMELSAQGPDS